MYISLLDSHIRTHGQVSVFMIVMNVDHELKLLVTEIKRLGKQNADGQFVVTFGTLFSDDKCANLFEALVGTLRAGKRRKIVKYDKELLLQGVDDNEEIVLLKDE